MRAGAKKEYDFKHKNQWRSWEWNQIARHVKKAQFDPADSVVFGMFGPSALDIKWAIKRGFHRENMICVERDAEVVRALREMGVNTIRGDFVEVLANWGREPPIRVVIADFCGGLGASVADFLDYVMHDEFEAEPLSEGCTIALNLLRGRDPWSKGFRSYITKFVQGMKDQTVSADRFFHKLQRDIRKVSRRSKLGCKVASTLLEDTGYLEALEWLEQPLQQTILRIDPLHRGLQAYLYFRTETKDDTKWAEDAEKYEAKIAEFIEKEDTVEFRYCSNSRLDEFFEEDIPVFRSYRSGNLVYDSIVWNWRDDDFYVEQVPRNPKISRKVAAAKAIRTQRLTELDKAS